MRSVAATALLVPLGACGWFEDTKNNIDNLGDTVAGLTNPLVVQGIVLGIDAPQDDQLDLSDSDLSEGCGMTLFLADASNADEIDSAPVVGALVDVSTGRGDVGVEDEGDGSYRVDPDDDAIDYEPGSTWTISANILDEASGDDSLTTIALPLPPAAQLNVGKQHDKNTPYELDFTGQGFKTILAIVYDPATGEVTFDNEPTSVNDVYNLTHGADDVTTFEIPGEAFPDDTVYALGIAGMSHNTGDDFDNANTALSTVMAGVMQIYAVNTVQVP